MTGSNRDKPMLKIKALKVQQPIGEFYIASVKAQDLIQISFADVRRLVDEEREVERYLGIQRPVEKKRVRDIKKYLEGSDATFPTSIIVAVDSRCATFDAEENGCGTLILSPYTPNEDDGDKEIEFKNLAKVLDGQHRIAAFMNEDQEYVGDLCEDGEFELNVAIFVGADIAEQAGIFATVNLAQTKVNKSLVYDLTELAKARSPYKTCHNVAVVLDKEKKSPLYKRIKRLGVATPGRSREPLTQAGFVESLVQFISRDPVTDRNNLLDGRKLRKATTEELRVRPFRNLFLSERDVDIAEILFNYFSAVEKRWPNSWNDLEKAGNLLPKSNAFKALMKFLRLDVYPEIVHDDFGLIPKVADFYPFFEKVELDDRDFTTRNFVPGSTGQSIFLKLLRGDIKLDEILEK